MKSIKPGRGPSMMGGVGSVIMVVFGVFWTILAAGMTAGMGLFGAIFPLFGVCFIAMGVVNAVYNFKNATGENRYSSFDIVDRNEESDPLNERFGAKREPEQTARPAGGFCPYCGAPVEGEYVYCRKCGRELPK
ncbi:MAG: zinc ribbon domain-containing protein [Butyricicoccus sp.]